MLKPMPMPTFAPIGRLLEAVGAVEGKEVLEGVSEGVLEGESGGLVGVGNGSCTYVS